MNIISEFDLDPFISQANLLSAFGAFNSLGALPTAVNLPEPQVFEPQTTIVDLSESSAFNEAPNLALLPSPLVSANMSGEIVKAEPARVISFPDALAAFNEDVSQPAPIVVFPEQATAPQSRLSQLTNIDLGLIGAGALGFLGLGIIALVRRPRRIVEV